MPAPALSLTCIFIYCLLFSRKVFHGAPVAAQHGPEWPVSLRQVSKLPLETVAENRFYWTSSFYGIFLLLFPMCSQSDTRSLDCFARIHPLPRTPTPPSVMKRWSTSCGSSWTQVGSLNCWPPRSNVVSCFKVDHILTSYGFNSDCWLGCWLLAVVMPVL